MCCFAASFSLALAQVRTPPLLPSEAPPPGSGSPSPLPPLFGPPQGHYVPAVSYRIYRANELGQGPLLINLAGLAIGNGLTAPAIQFPAYAEYALMNKLIDQGLYDSIQGWMPLCTWGANWCNSHNWRWACIIALEVCQVGLGRGKAGGEGRRCALLGGGGWLGGRGPSAGVFRSGRACRGDVGGTKRTYLSVAPGSEHTSEHHQHSAWCRCAIWGGGGG